MGGDRDETHHGIQQQARHGRDRAADSTVGWVRGFAPDAARRNRRGAHVPDRSARNSRGVQKVIQQYEEKVAEMAEAKVDVVNPSGAPPFVLALRELHPKGRLHLE
jgi:hypothetical protein